MKLGKANWAQHTHLFKKDEYECSACGAMYDKSYLQTKTDDGILFHDSILRFIKFHQIGGDRVYEQENKIYS